MESARKRTRLGGLRFARWAALLVVVVGALGTTGCTETTAQQPVDRAQKLRQNRHQEVVEALDARLPALLRQVSRQRANALSIDAVLQKPDKWLPGVKLRRVQYLKKLYARRAYKPAWVDIDQTSARLTTPAHDLLAALEKGVSAHGLWPAELHLDRLRDIELPSSPAGRDAAFTATHLDPRERQAILDWLDDHPDAATHDDKLDSLANRLVAAGQPLARLSAPVTEQVRRLRNTAQTSGRVDVLLSDAFVQYAVRMRFANRAWQRGHTWPVRLQDAAKADAAKQSDADAGDQARPTLTGKELVEARRRYLVMHSLGPVFDDPTTVGQVLATLPPPFEPYRRLTRAFVRYHKIVAAGGWPTLPDAAEGLKRGANSDLVPTIKRRLRIEGYYGDDDSGHFGNKLRHALIIYQSTHQLWENGWMTPQTLRSLNVTATERWDQIRLTLQRWRESSIGPDTEYVHVNLPDFHASVWQDGKRQLYFKVIVGQTTREKNDDGKLAYVHATPRFSDTLQYIVFNPYWNVPKRIREDELEPKFKEDPGYFDKMGYEYHTDANGYEELRQKPGPKNALGRVKFLFPNSHNVYMHDTPSKYIFKYPFRAYSHGCIRMQDPMALANYLLDLDGRWKDNPRTKDDNERQDKLDEWYAKDGETWVRLRHPLPVHIEYFVVRVDDDGHANFLADLYRLDKPRLKKIAARVDQLGLANASKASASAE